MQVLLSITRLLAAVLAPALTAPGSSSLLTALGLAGAAGLAIIALAAMSHYVAAQAASLMVSAHRRFAHEPADVSDLLTQSDPDAAGRPRPRAPSFFLAVA